MVSLIRWECQLVGLGLYNALAKPIAYAILDRSHLLEISPPPRWRWRSHLDRSHLISSHLILSHLDRSHLLVLTHGVDDAPDRRHCTAAAASTHDERCWRLDGALVGGGKLGPPYMYGPPNATGHSESGSADIETFPLKEAVAEVAQS